MTKLQRRIPAILLSACLAAQPLYAVEVSLEENRAERGNIGYVDMQAIFHLFPQTQKAKENFEEVVRQAEDQINLRKSDLISMRAEIAQLKAERDYLAKNPIAAGGASSSDDEEETPPPLPGTEPASKSTAKETPPAAQAPAPPAAVQTPIPVPGISTATVMSTATATVPAVTISTTLMINPALATTTVLGSSLNQPVAASTIAAATPPAPPPAAPPPPPIHALPGISDTAGTIPAKKQKPASPAATTLADLDRKIADKTKLMQDKETEFKTYQTQVEKNLLDLESRRTEILLGRIYEVVQRVAREEGVSVVVDKSQILFGHKAVDLTPKVLEKLKTLSP